MRGLSTNVSRQARETRGTMSQARRIVSWITLVAAAYLIVVPFALSLFSRTADAEKLSDYYRPVMSERGLDNFRHNLAIVNTGGTELYGKFLPTLQQQLGLEEAQFDAFVADGFPHVANFLKRAPEVVKYLNPATKKVLAQQDNFHDADQFPLANLDVRVGPWALFLLGLVLLALGLWIRSGISVLPIVAVAVIGFGLLVGPAVLGWFHQTDAAEEVAQAARGPFSTAVSNATVDDTYKFDAAFKEMRLSMFPAIGRQLGKSPTEMDAYLHTTFPATMRFLDTWDESIYEGAHDLSLSQIRFKDEFHNADSTPYQALPWIFMLPGAVLLGAGAYALVARRRAPDRASRAAR